VSLIFDNVFQQYQPILLFCFKEDRMRWYSLLVTFCLAGFVRAQEFPKSFMGHWEGELHWYGADKKEPQKVKMQLIIQPADSAGHYTWQIIYGARNEDNRPYLLKPVDTAKGHWVIDERDGIVLDQYWVGNRLASSFTVQSTTIVSSYWIEGDELMAEFYSLSAQSIHKTGKGTEDVPFVDSYAAKGFQKAVLRRAGKGDRWKG
jgi:hypothetical protein